MDDAAKAALIAYLEAQVLAANTLLAELAGEPAEEPEVPKKAAPPRKAAPKKAAPVAVADDDDEDEDETGVDAAREAELNVMKITALKALAIKRGFNADGVKAASKAELVDAILKDEAEDATDEDEDEGDDEGSVTYTREELLAMGIRKAKAYAMEQGHTVADLKGLKLDEVVDLVLGEGDAEEDDEDADESGDGEDYYTREDYEGMSLAELKAIARAYQQDDPNFKVPANIGKPALIDLLMEG